MGVKGEISRLVISYSSIKRTKTENCFETICKEVLKPTAGKQEKQHTGRWSSSHLTPPPQAVPWQIKGTREVPEGALGCQR